MLKCPYCEEFIEDDSLFCDQCGRELDFPKYLVGEGLKIPLREGAFGRTTGVYPELKVCQFVSCMHGVFKFKAEGWFVQDAGSTNGTYLNDVRLQPLVDTRISRGDTLKISRLTFRLK